MNKHIQYTNYDDGYIYTAICNHAEKGEYVSLIRGKRCYRKEDFFREISASFQFPMYFGGNWDAVDDCLCDLDWLKSSGVFIVIHDFSHMFPGEHERREKAKNILVEIMQGMIEYWEEENFPVEIWLNN